MNVSAAFRLLFWSFGTAVLAEHWYYTRRTGAAVLCLLGVLAICAEFHRYIRHG